MPANGHVPSGQQTNKAPAIVAVNTLSEDDQAINPADHDGKCFSEFHLVVEIFLLFFRTKVSHPTIRLK